MPSQWATSQTTTTRLSTIPAAGSLFANSASLGQITAPHFVATFKPAFTSSAGLLAPSSTMTGLGGGPLPTLPTLNHPFVVGPGFSPIPAKVVTTITSGQFVVLEDLLSSNITAQDEEPQVLFEGRVVFTTGKRKPKRVIEDIVSWMEAFSIYAMILTTTFPGRWRDLMQYQLLILRTYQQFGGKAWRTYDRAFREHAAAVGLSDWSELNSQLFNFHTDGAPARNNCGVDGPYKPEAKGSASSDIVCHSWNRGSCTAPFSTCRYAHQCSACNNDHRAKDCSVPLQAQSGDIFNLWSGETGQIIASIVCV